MRLPSPETISTKRWRRVQEVISRTAELLSAELPLDSLFEQLCPMLARFIDASTVFIALRDGDSARVEYLYRNGLITRPHDRLEYAARLADVITSGRLILVQPTNGRNGTLAKAERTAPNGSESAIYVPLKYGCEIIGVLSVQSDKPAAYDSDDARLLESCASFLALRVHDANIAAEAAQLRALASIDSLTAIANRRAFDTRLDVEWRRNAREQAPLSVIMVDVDLFKSFNDNCGHIAGDACLRQVASAMSQCLKRPADLIARFGGEEFVALLPATDLSGAVTVAERLRSAVATLDIIHAGSQLGRVSVSAGVATIVPEPGGDPGNLVQTADKALYRAKIGGRNRVVSENYVSDEAVAAPRFEFAHNLPAPLTNFLGRERELAELLRLLATDRLVTVVGPGGVGKTRISLRVGESSFGLFRDGIWFVDLAPLSDPDEVVNKVRSTLMLSDADDTQPLQRVAEHLRHRQLLLVLDNCEHLIDACAKLAREVLSAAPNARILATSRQPLGILGEATVRLGGMSIPGADAKVTASVALHYEAVRLFDQRARAAGTFFLSDDNVGTVAEICRRLDGLPLAIELAAARTGMLSVDQLAARLDDRFRLFANGDRSAPLHQQTLRAVVEWSYNLLGPHERAFLRSLAVFSGTFTLEAADDVCGLEGAGIISTDLVAALVDKSLISVDREADEPRFHLLESTREFAKEELERSGDSRSVRARHAAHFARVVGAAEETHSTAAWPDSANLLSRERENVRSALQFCLEEGEDVTIGAALVAGLVQWWHEAGLPHEGRRWIKRAIGVAAMLGDAMQARLWLALARVHLGEASEADRQEATEAAERAATMFRALGDDRYTARSLQVMSKFYTLAGAFDRSEQTALEALALAETANDLVCQALCLNNLGVVENFRNDHAKAIAYEERSAALYEAINDEFGQALAVGNIADSAMAVGEFERAALMFRKVLSVYERGKNRFQIGLALCNLGGAEVARGKDDLALPVLLDSLDIIEEYRDHWLLQTALVHLAEVLSRRGSFERAAAFLGAAESAQRSSGIPWCPSDKLGYDRAAAPAQHAMGPDQFLACLADGRSWKIERAILEGRRL